MNINIKSKLLSAIGVSKKNKSTADGHSQDLGSDTDKRIDQNIAFWRELLHNAPPLLELPQDYTRPNIESECNSHEQAIVNESATASLYSLAEQNSVSIDTILLAGFFALLYRYTGQEDILVVSPFRFGQAEDSTKGLAVNSKIAFYHWSNSGDVSFAKALRNLQESQNTISVVGPAPVQDLMSEANTSAGATTKDISSVFQLAFEFNEEDDAVKGKAEMPEIPQLFLSVGTQKNSLAVRLHYDNQTYKPSTIKRMLSHYRELLASSVSDAKQPISQLPMLTGEEQQILSNWNNTSVDFPAPNSVHELFEAKVEKSPDAEALVFSNTRLSYKELNKKANQLAHYLRAQGVGPGFLVGIYMDRCADAVIALLGILKAGGTYLPLDASYPADRLRYILHDAGAGLLLTHEHLSPELSELNEKLLYMDTNWKQISQCNDDNPASQTSPNDIAFVLYTSGSTGNPKGVQVTHSNLTNYFFIWEHTHQLSNSISAICQMTFFSFAVFQGDVIRALCSGNKLVLCSREVLMSPRKLLELMRRENVDFAEFVPVLLRGLVNHVKEAGEDLAFMKVMVVGADRWYLREHKDVMKLCANDKCLVHVYGLSETTLDSTYFTNTDAELPEHQLVPIGRPFPNVRVYILDHHMKPVPMGVAGELYIGGSGVAKGYHNRSDLTAEKFIVNPYGNSENDRLFSTGDYARYLDDGNIAFLGRRDQQIKIRGFRVELGEIEARMEQHPDVKTAIVQSWEPNPGVTQLVGYYVLGNSSKLSIDELQRFLVEKLPEFMVPSHFIELDSIPLTPSSKINRKALPLPSEIEIDDDNISQDSTNELQQTIAQICSHALGKAIIKFDDDFERLGADSMAIMSIVTGLENAFGIVVEEEEINEETFTSINTLVLYVNSKI